MNDNRTPAPSSGGPRRAEPPGVAARRAACRAVEGVLERREFLEHGLETARGYESLAPRDRAFARLIAATTLRRLGQIDGVLNRFLRKPPSGRVRAVLQCGAAELIYLNAKPHAAVSSATELAGADPRTRPFKGLVNAVLRRVSEVGADIAFEQPVHRNIPAWLWRSWSAAYGEETARAIIEAHLGDPPLDLTPRNAHSSMAHGLIGLTGGYVLPTGSIRLEGGGAIESIPGFESGQWWVQDAAAAIPARLLSAQPEETVFDLCAAPGGKTLQLASEGANVFALDASATRLERLRQNLARTGLKAEMVVTDILKWTPPAQADAVLLDAPCSATGTLRRSPDAAWIRRPEEVAKLTGLQDRMLDRAGALLRPGGRMVYCVCSLQPEEGEARIAAFLERHPDMRVSPVRPLEIPGLQAAITPQGTLRILPAFWTKRGGLDGFFAARLEKAPFTGRSSDFT